MCVRGLIIFSYTKFISITTRQQFYILPIHDSVYVCVCVYVTPNKVSVSILFRHNYLYSHKK